MSNSYIAEEWNCLKDDLDDSGFADAVESEAAKELIQAKQYIPEEDLKESGLERYSSAEELQKNRERLIEIAAYFSDQSISSETESGEDGVMCYEAHMLNVEFFQAVLIIDFAATLYHITGGFPLNVHVIFDDNESAEAMEKPVKMVANMFNDVKSCTISVAEAESPDEEENSGNDSNPYDDAWTRDLNEIVERFAAGRDSSTFSELLGMLLKGITCRVDAQFPAEIAAGENGKAPFELIRLKAENNDQYLVLQTKQSDKFRYTATKKLLGGLMEFQDEEIKGLAINPYEENIVIDRDFIESAMNTFFAGMEFQKEKEAREPEEEDERTLKTSRPMTEADFEVVEDAIRNLVHEDVDSYFILDFENFVDDDAVLFMQTKNWGNGYRVEIAFDMSDFDWDDPLILAADDVSLEDTLNLFRKIGLEGEKTENIAYVDAHFKDTGFHGKKD